MTDLLDKTILVGMGIEKRIKKVLDELAEEGKTSGLPPRQEIENRIVEEGVKTIRDLIATVRAGKEKVDKEIQDLVERLLDRFKVVTRGDIEIVERMAQVAREKVDALEKRVDELEKKAVNRDRNP